MRTIRSLIFLLLVIIIITSAFALWRLSEQEEIESPSGTSKSSEYAAEPDALNLPDDWKTYTKDSFLTFAYPPRAQVQTRDSSIKVSYTGSDNATGQITDGYQVEFRTNSLNGQSLKAFTKNQKANEEEATSDLRQQPTLQGKTGYRYTIDEVNDAVSEVYVLPTHVDKALIVKGYVADPNNNDYRSQVQKVRASAWNRIPFSSEQSSEVSTVLLPLLDTTNSLGGVQRGCDTIVPQRFTVSSTSTPLDATYQKLFSVDKEQPRTISSNGENVKLFHMLGKDFERTSASLSFNNVSTEGGVARVRLSGKAKGYGGVCDHPRRRIQITEAALQFPGIHTVHIFLNGEKSELGPDARGE